MKKKLIPLIIAALLLIGAVVALVLLSREEAVPEEPESSLDEETVYVMGNAEASPSRTVAVQNAVDSFTIVREDVEGEDTRYYIEELSGYDFSKYMITAITGAVESLTARSVVVEAGADLSLYGLSSPAVTATATYANGEKRTLYIGDNAPGSEGYYVKTDHSDAVYLVAASNLSYFDRASLEFLGKTVTESNLSGDFDRMILSGTLREQPITIERAPEEEDTTSPLAGTHEITAPIASSLDVSRGAPALQTAFGVTAQEVVAIGADEETLAAYGLDEPYSLITVLCEEPGNFTLSSSAPDEDGFVYMRREDRDLIYKVDAVGMDWIEVQLFNLMNKMIILPYIDNLTQVRVVTPAADVTFALAGDGDDLTVTAAGQELDVANFRKFYQNLVAASYDSVPEEPLPEDAEPVMTYTYTFRDGRDPAVVSFYTGSARRYYVRLDDGEAYYLPSTYVDKVQGDVERILAGEEITTYL